MPNADEPPVLVRAPHPTPEEIAAPALPAVSDPLDAVLGESPPEHTWVGMAFVWMAYAVGAGSVITALDLTGSSGVRDPHIIGTLLVLLVAPVGGGCLWMARAIQKFRLHGYGLAMFMLVTTLLGAAASLVEADSLLDAALAGGLIAFTGTWIRYFLMRFSDFS